MHELTRTNLLALALSASLSVTALGCGDATNAAASASSTAAKASTSSASSADKAKTAAPAETAKPVELVDRDLGGADPKWAGWTAKGPAEAKVMADGVAGARLAASGPSVLDRKPGGDQGFDIAFAWGKDDLAELKTNLKKGADDSKSTLTFTKDEADRLEFTMESKDVPKSYHFVIHMKVDKADITCKNGNMMGAGNEAEHKRLMDACNTLAKKAK